MARPILVRLVYVAQSVRFVDHDEIPRRLPHIRFFGTRELVRTNDGGVALKRIQVPAAHRLVKRAGF